MVVKETEDSPALTPEGNAALVDDFGGNKQLITITTKSGNYFYILIDRANEDKETAVHFLNQVDEADLMALMEDGQSAEETARCLQLHGKMRSRCGQHRTARCALRIWPAVPARSRNPPAPETPGAGEQEPAGLNPAMLLVVLAVLGGICFGLLQIH